MQEQMGVDHKIEMRYLSGVNANQRVLWGSRTFDIETWIVPRGVNHQMFLFVRETQVGDS